MVQITPPMPIDTTPSNAYIHPGAIKRCSEFEIPRLNHEAVLSMTARATFQTSAKARLLDLPLLLLPETSFTAYLNNDTQKVIKAMQQVSIHWKPPKSTFSVAPIPRPPLLDTKTGAKQKAVVALDDDASETSSANTVDSKTAALAKRVRKAMVRSEFRSIKRSMMLNNCTRFSNDMPNKAWALLNVINQRVLKLSSLSNDRFSEPAVDYFNSFVTTYVLLERA